MSFFDELNKFSDFEDFKNRDIWNKIKAQPERAFIGAWDPFSSAMWSKITGNQYDPAINQLGGPTNAQLRAGHADNATRGTHAVAGAVAGYLGGPSAIGGLGSGLDAASGGLGIGSAAPIATDAAPALGAGDMLASSTGAGMNGGLLADSATTAAPVASAAPATGGGLSNAAKYAQAAQGLLNQGQPQQTPAAQIQAPDPQKIARARALLLQENQLQSLRMKPNKTIDDYMMLARATRNQGLLGQ